MPWGTSRWPVVTAQTPQFGSFTISDDTGPPIDGRLIGARSWAGCRGGACSGPAWEDDDDQYGRADCGDRAGRRSVRELCRNALRGAVPAAPGPRRVDRRRDHRPRLGGPADL